MKKFLKNIMLNGLTADSLKLIALCTMVIDHIAFYFNITNTFGVILRTIGRVAMPIFVYLLVQGFFKTKNFKKYLLRIFICACVTQLVIILGYILNMYVFDSYITVIYNYGNILFSFALSLLALKIIHEKDILVSITKLSEKQNYVVRVILLLMCASIYYIIPIDYGICVLLLSVLFYICERIKITFLITKSQNPSYNIYNESSKRAFSDVLSKLVDTDTINKVYKIMVGISLALIVTSFSLNIFTLFSLAFILLYNGERNNNIKNLKINKKLYYIFFPVHHFILYLLAMLVS